MSRYVYSDLGGDADLRELVELFISEIPARVEEMIARHREGDLAELRRMVHQMKGAAGSYGFHAVTPVAAQLERSLLDGRDEPCIAKELAALVDLCRRLRSGCGDAPHAALA